MADYEDDYEPISDEEKLKIVTHFLLSSPPGELNEVLSDVRELLGNDELLNKALSNILRTYNTDQFVAVKPPDSDHDVLLTKFGEVDGTHYLDPAGAQVLEVDHEKQTVLSVRPCTAEEQLDAESEEYRQVINNAFKTYLGNHFKEGALCVYGKKNGKALELTLCIAATKANLYNYWSGRWRSTWTGTVTPGQEGEVTLTGKIRVNVHYFEEGNVQLNSDVDKTVKVKVGGTSTTAGAAMAKAIEDAEDAYQQGLQESYADMSDTAFKALRRKMPVNMKRYDFNQHLNLKIAQELSKK